jgi:hypothetical protein
LVEIKRRPRDIKCRSRKIEGCYGLRRGCNRVDIGIERRGIGNKYFKEDNVEVGIERRTVKEKRLRREEVGVEKKGYKERRLGSRKELYK